MTCGECCWVPAHASTGRHRARVTVVKPAQLFDACYAELMHHVVELALSWKWPLWPLWPKPQDWPLAVCAGGSMLTYCAPASFLAWGSLSFCRMGSGMSSHVLGGLCECHARSCFGGGGWVGLMYRIKGMWRFLSAWCGLWSVQLWLLEVGDS